MKLRRRDPHHLFIAQGYQTLKHDGSDQGLKKLRTMASLNTLNSDAISHRRQANKSQTTKSRANVNKQQKTLKKQKKHQSNKTLGVTGEMNNVNSFKHLMQVPYMNTAQLKWAFGLRAQQETHLPRSISQIPSTYYKTTQSSKTHHQISQVPSRLNFNTFMHLTRRGQHPSVGTLRFQTSLRQPQQQTRKKSPQIVKKQRQFKTIPVKDHHDYPKLLNTQSIKKKTINPQQDLQSAFDGSHNYPSYTNYIIRDRNYNNIRQHLKRPERGVINLPSLGWQTNLRFYQDQNASKNANKNSQKVKQKKNS